MAADIDRLVPEFREKLVSLLANCLARGIEMRPYMAVRDPFEQGRFWRQSRTTEEVNKKIAELLERGAPFLAHCIDSVGPQNGPHVTNAVPGLSWHQWGEAVDCFWAVKGKAVWDLKAVVKGVNGYMIYADEAKKLGLDAGLLWSGFKDAPHVQFRKTSSPAKAYSLEDIDGIMKERFSD